MTAEPLKVAAVLGDSQRSTTRKQTKKTTHSRGKEGEVERAESLEREIERENTKVQQQQQK